MRVLLFANNWVGWQIAEQLVAAGDEIAGVVLHPIQRRRYGDEILGALKIAPEQAIDGSRLREPSVLEHVRALTPQIGVSAMFGYILRRELLDLLPAGCINIHPALLPYNRGAYPNVWSIVEGTPAGVTIHYIDQGVDTGEIVGQREVLVEPVDTGAALYAKLERACVELFCDVWPLVRAGQAPRTPQPSGGSTHRMRDVETIDEIDLDRSYTGRQLIDLLRARTFPPYRGAFFRHAGRKIYIDVQLRYDNDGGE